MFPKVRLLEDITLTSSSTNILGFNQKDFQGNLEELRFGKMDFQKMKIWKNENFEKGKFGQIQIWKIRNQEKLKLGKKIIWKIGHEEK